LRGEVDTLEKAHARVAHDLYYIEHWFPWLDLKILLKTVGNFLPRVKTHTDICMIHFPAEMSRYRFAPECPEL
jgi:hypothetical protein